jgi:hypothetical protein
LLRGGGLPRGTLQVFGRGTDFCKIAPVESCRRLIARPDRSAKESAHPGTSGKTLECRFDAHAASCENVRCMFGRAWRTQASHGAPKKSRRNAAGALIRSEPNFVTATSTFS